jgi:hypothetical protein
MIVECEFTNASDLKRERVVFLTDMRLMTNGQRPFRVFWEYDRMRKRTSVTLTLMHLHRAMHDSEFRIQMETDTLIMAKWPLDQRACWFLMFHDEQMAPILRIQAAVRRWVMHRRLCVDRMFSKAAAASRILSAGQLNQDTVDLILLYSIRPNGPSSHHSSKNNFIVWSKSECDGQIFD